jgi:tetratricopeptide (TPR) repeat protein
MTTAIIGICLIFLAIVLSRPITTFIHEMGHAIPALLFTKEPVVIYVGSYGDISNSTTTTLGRLSIIFKFHLRDWQLGLCRHQRAATLWQELLIILGGPLFSLLTAVVAMRWLPVYQSDQYIAFAIGIFLTSGILDFFVNIIPASKPLQMYDGGIAYNDGAQFVQLLKTSRYPEVYFDGIQLLNEGRETEGLEKLKAAIEQGVHDLSVYQLAMAIVTANYPVEEVMAFHENYGSFFKLSSADYVAMGQLYQQENLDNKAIRYYSEAIKLEYTNVKALTLRGNLLLEIGRYQEGKADLAKVELMEGRRALR